MVTFELLVDLLMDFVGQTSRRAALTEAEAVGELARAGGWWRGC